LSKICFYLVVVAKYFLSGNKFMKFIRISLLLVVIAAIFASKPLSSCADELEAVTKPSADIEVSFVKAGRVADVLVKEGDSVKAGQLLAKLDDKVEQLQLLQLQAKARDNTKIEAAEADMLQKKADLKKFEGASKKGAATEWEVEHARLNLRQAELSIQLAKFENEQDRRKYEEGKADIEHAKLLSTINGLVEEVTIEPGESPQPGKTAIRLVKIDPLWIDAIIPLTLARNLKPGNTVQIRFPGHGNQGIGENIMGRITFVSAVARAASDTLRIRVEVANSQLRPAGERVKIAIPGP
jgi:RND family efflux transporter MFP subunit